MTEKTLKQLELPILADINSKSVEDTSAKNHDILGFHQPASKEDESIYQLISNSYFSNSNK